MSEVKVSSTLQAKHDIGLPVIHALFVSVCVFELVVMLTQFHVVPAA